MLLPPQPLHLLRQPRRRCCRAGRKKVGAGHRRRRAVPDAVLAAGHQPDPVHPVPRRQQLDPAGDAGVHLRHRRPRSERADRHRRPGSASATPSSWASAPTPARCVGGEGIGATVGLGLPIWIWLPAAGDRRRARRHHRRPGRRAARAASTWPSSRSGLVFIGIHLANIDLGPARSAGDPGLGRDFPSFDIRLWKEDDAARRHGAATARGCGST